MSYSDKVLTCSDCGAQFTFTAGEQEFHASKGFTNEPRRCASCRLARRGQREGGGGSYAGSYGAPREMFSATCESCGREARVPFQPRGDRPVYCSDCFRQRQPAGGYSAGYRGDYGGGYGDRGRDRDRDRYDRGRDRDRDRDRGGRW